MSLGPVAGTSVVGRPLDLVAQIQFDEPSQGDGSGCVTVQLRFGDKVIDDARVEVKFGSDTAHHLSYARITSAVPVDEPFVTVVLIAGCTHPYSRRYVLLADAPRLQTAAPTLALPALAKPAAVVARATRQTHTLPSGAVGLQRTIATRTARAAPTQRLAAPREERPRSQGSLQLAAWDPDSERMPRLRISTELASSPTVDMTRRTAALAAWGAFNAQPQDLLRTADRLRDLEGEVNALRGLSAPQRAEIASARGSLQSAQDHRHTASLVTLVALLSGGAAAFLFHRSRRHEPTVADSLYGPIDPTGEGAHRRPPAGQRSPMPRTIEPERTLVSVRPLPAMVRQAPSPAPMDSAAVNRTAIPQPYSGVDGVGSAPRHAGFLEDGAPTQPSELKVGALEGAQQQAAFFASLGQIDEAVAVFTSYLQESSVQPLLAYLELFQIYHGTGMQAEYELLRSTFRQTFGMDVESFGEYKDEPRELEMFLLPITKIASTWPSERSLEIIEELLFKRPATPRDLLSLEAYRELLWLYSLGQEVVHNTRSPAGLQLLGDIGLPNSHFILPWAVSDRGEPTELSLARLDAIEVASQLTSFGVDIDLTARGDGYEPGDVLHQRPLNAGAAPAVPLNDVDTFDAVMDAQSRRHSL